MRLIHTTDLVLRSWLVDPPPYAILSHRWASEGDELTYGDFVAGHKRDTTGWTKIQRLCLLAKERGLEWAWIDTACIDKTSSAELSEAINSMFAWYRDSAICFVFLTDSDKLILDDAVKEPRRFYTPSWKVEHDVVFQPEVNREYREYMHSWFGRAWTLQELLAPRDVLFYHVTGCLLEEMYLLGSRETLKGIEPATGIPRKYLLHEEPIYNASVARRMSWTSRRTSTRPEDIAYSLLGIFDVNMPLLYGEGNKAFTRLQETILQTYEDETLFAWAASDPDAYSGLLASSPTEFGHQSCLERWTDPITGNEPSPSRVTPRGVEFSVAHSGTMIAFQLWQIIEILPFWVVSLVLKQFTPDSADALMLGANQVTLRLKAPLKCYCTCKANKPKLVSVELHRRLEGDAFVVPNLFQRRVLPNSFWCRSGTLKIEDNQAPKSYFRSKSQQQWFSLIVSAPGPGHEIPPGRQMMKDMEEFVQFGFAWDILCIFAVPRLMDKFGHSLATQWVVEYLLVSSKQRLFWAIVAGLAGAGGIVYLQPLAVLIPLIQVLMVFTGP